MEEWNNHDGLALNSALQLDILRQKREGNIQKPVKLEVIYAFMDKLSAHSKIMKNMLDTDNYPSYYLFHNPLIEGILRFYKVSLNDYKNTKRTQCSEFVGDVKKGLDMILKSFESFESAPTIIPLEEINELRDFCLNMSDRELYHKYTNSYYGLALAA